MTLKNYWNQRADNRSLINQKLGRSHVNVETFLPPPPPIPSCGNIEPESVRLSPKMEFAIVSGLGILIVASPTIIEFVRKKVQVVKTRLICLKDFISQADFSRKLAVLNRRRKKGSLIRVVGSILPNAMFNPPCRIYIPKWAQLASNQWNLQPHDITGLTPIRNPDLPSENDVGDGLIEAFEIDSEVISSLSGAEDDEEDETSSTPEGWTQEQRLMANFNPTMNATDASFTRCSTPKITRKKGHYNTTQTQGPSKNCSKVADEPKQAEIEELKKMVTLAMVKISQLELENSRLQQVQEPIPISASQMPQPTVTMNSPEEQENRPIPPPMPLPTVPISSNNNVTSIAPGAPPPPPPPPPPPMPPMPLEGSKKLVISKKGGQDKLIQKKPQVSLSDVLKELPNAKLRRVERSPGGTPIKPQLKLANQGAPIDIGSQLAFALKKRYESMHSPACDSDLDKENIDGSDDSFDDDSTAASSAKRVLFPSGRSPRRRSGNSLENRLPFGQHLLKKRNIQQGNTEISPLTSSPFREQNN